MIASFGISVGIVAVAGFLYYIAKKFLSSPPNNAVLMPGQAPEIEPLFRSEEDFEVIIPAEELRKSAQEKMGMDTERSYNFGVVGGSGVGKSSLVKALCKTNDSDRDAPLNTSSAGTIMEEIVKCVHSDFDHIVFWDLPGGGTIKYPESTYFTDLCLYAFDFIIIVVKGRFRELDLNIAMSAHKYKVPFAFVWTNSDYDLGNMKMETGRPTREIKSDYGSKVRGNIQGQLPLELKGAPIFVLSKLVLEGRLKVEDYGIDEEEFVTCIYSTAEKRRSAAAQDLRY